MPESPEIAALAKQARDGMDADERILMAVSNGPNRPEKWTAVERSYSEIRRWHVDGQPSNVASGMFAGDAAHIARHDPHRILADVAARRTLLDDALAWRHGLVRWDHDRVLACDSVLGKPCDCGRDARVRAVLTALATPYQEEAS
jgi:hypothetical protein